MVQVIQDGLKCHGTHQLLVYAEDVNTLGGSVHTVKERLEASVRTSMGIGLKVCGTPKKTSKIKFSKMHKVCRLESKYQTS